MPFLTIHDLDVHMESLHALRKEKSRNAARSRRGKENFEFYELAKMLPIPGAISSQLDKASIIRLTISYLRMRDFASQGDLPWGWCSEGNAPRTVVEAPGSQGKRKATSLSEGIIEQHLGGHILQSLDGFVFALSQEGKFLYISETVSIYLGLSQVELTGSSMFDYIHPGDHSEAAEQLGLKLPTKSSKSANQKPSCITSSSSSLLHSSDSDLERSFFIRMKSTLIKRGLHVKSSGFKVVHVTGRLHLLSSSCTHSVPSRVLGLVALAHTLPPSIPNEVRIDCHMFVFRVNVDLQIVYCESRITDYMDLSPSELVGKSCYQFVHVEDVEGIRQSHIDLLRKGQVVTQYYRWLQKSAGFVWVQSYATVSVNLKNPTERHMVWLNYILSKPDYKTIPLDMCQLPTMKSECSKVGETSAMEPDDKKHDSSLEIKLGNPYTTWNTGAHSTAKERNVTGPIEADCKSKGSSINPSEAEEIQKGMAMHKKRIKLEVFRDGEIANSESGKSASEEEADRMAPKMDQRINGYRWKGDPPRFHTSGYPPVIQAQRNPDEAATLGLCIKTQQPLAPAYKGRMWDYMTFMEGSCTRNTALPMEKHSLRQPSSSLYVSIPEDVLITPETDNSNGGGPHKVPLAASSPQGGFIHLHPAASLETMSPPFSGSSSEDRAAIMPLGYPNETEILQQFQARNMVLPLMHQLRGELSQQHSISSTLISSQSLYSTSTIRYASADTSLAMKGNTGPTSHPIGFIDLGSTETKMPIELMYHHHLHRLNVMPSSTGFATIEHLFPSLSLSLGPVSTQRAAEWKESHGTSTGTFS
ncbi:neuronal PAS domain-containing protein 1 [Microcaecilia unicolor]|uniref:Neuronal PAS domain-containing protein 1 n=1 Tax=Microcaecilia unicolor TaxID=1415580 RepID=A0A6P7ZII5_9AMPH|nr:neuronal PAS domain-containing protein 1 [Microcaecilia unicolor]